MTIGPPGPPGVPPRQPTYPARPAPPPIPYPVGVAPPQFSGVPTARKSLRAPLIALIGGGVALVVVLIAGLLIPISTDGTSSAPESVVARNRLYTAQVALSTAPAQHYRGTVTSKAGRAEIDLKVSNEGDSTGTVKVNGTSFDYLGAGGHSLLKGPASGWSTLGYTPKQSAGFDNRWTRITPDLFGIDLGSVLAPRVLASSLDPNYQNDTGEVTLGKPVAVNGIQTVPATSGGVTTYLAPSKRPAASDRPTMPASSTEDPDDEIDDPVDLDDLGPVANGNDEPVRIEADGIGDDGGTSFDLGVEPFDRNLLYGALGVAAAAAAKNAADSAISLNANGEGALGPCTQTSCTLTYRLSNTVRAGKNVTVRSVTAFVVSRMTLDGAPVQNCAQTLTMPPNGSAPPFICVASYPPVSPGNHSVRATVLAQVKLDALVVREVIETVARNKKLGPQEFENYVPNPAINKDVSVQKQQRHLVQPGQGQPKKSYLLSLEDAQKILDLYRSGRVDILGYRGHPPGPVVRVPGVTGYNNNSAHGFIGQPTNVFWIKGTRSPSVVPISPLWTQPK